jgi:predicted phosphoribosyltransferase
MRFLCRLEAGRALARKLQHLRGEPGSVVLLALPRGGIPVAYEVARALGLPLEVLLTRRLEPPDDDTAPTLGAVCEGGTVVLNPGAVPSETVSRIADATLLALERDVTVYRGERPLPLVAGRCVIVVDDGITSGASVRAAARTLRKLGARRIVAAAPVIQPSAAERVLGEVDQLVALQSPAEFIGVGYWYTRRGLSEDQALSLLARARRELGEAVTPHGWIEAPAAH